MCFQSQGIFARVLNLKGKLAREVEEKKMVGWWQNRREMKLLVNIMLPLCVHWIAQEMTHSAIIDVTTSALCPDKTSCSEVIYLNGLQQTVSL